MPNDIDYYLQFIEALDQGGHFEVSEWEANFLESLLKKRPKYLSEKQKDVIRRMAKTYLNEEIS